MDVSSPADQRGFSKRLLQTVLELNIRKQNQQIQLGLAQEIRPDGRIMLASQRAMYVI